MIERRWNQLAGRNRLASAVLIALVVCVLGPPSAVFADTPLLAKKIEFDGADGEELFRLDPESAGVELQRAKGKKRLATYEREGKKLAIDLPKVGDGGSVEFNGKQMHFQLRDAKGTVRWVLLQEPDKDWRLTDPAGKLHCKLKLRDDGLKLVDASDTTHARIKVKEDKISIRNGDGKEILRTKDTRSALAAACFQLKGLSMPEKGAFALAAITYLPKK